MTNKEEFELMKTNPNNLFDYYMSVLLSDQVLDSDQKIKFEYLKKLLVKE
jgi:hypothetical protein